MLDMGFLPDIKHIIKLALKKDKYCFSATMPDDIVKLSSSILKDPEKYKSHL